MKRLFIAVDIDEAARAAIGCIASGLRRRLDKRIRVSWVRPDRMHLTLHFFGQADTPIEHRISEALANPVPQAPFDVSFEGVGVFPPSGSPRVVWLGIRDGLADVLRVQQTLQRRLDMPSAHEAAFKPHLTLARFRDRAPRGELGEIAGVRAAAGPCRIDRVTLYESHLSPAGPTYVRLAEALLTP